MIPTVAAGIQELRQPTWHRRAKASPVLHPAQLKEYLHIELSHLIAQHVQPLRHNRALPAQDRHQHHFVPELFEKLYLTPKVPHVGDAYKRYANPTPMGFVGFVISTFSFAMVMMGWGGAAGLSGVAGIFFFVGPVLLLLGTIFEWIMGNFFPVSEFCSGKVDA